MFRSLVCFLALSPFLFSASISHGAVVGEWTFDEYLPTDGILPLNFRHADTSGNGRDMRNLDQILTFSQSFSAGAPQYGGGTAIQFTGNELIGSGYLELLTRFSGFVNLAGSPDGGPAAARRLTSLFRMRVLNIPNRPGIFRVVISRAPRALVRAIPCGAIRWAKP